MDLLTLAASKRYTNEKTEEEYELLEQVTVNRNVQNIRKIEVVSADESETGNAQIRIYGVKEEQE